MIKEYFVSDFETTGEKQYKIEGKTRVYLHYTEAVYNDTSFLGCSIDEYFEFITQEKPLYETKDNGTIKRIVFFHNLKFDILFFEYYLLSLGKLPNSKSVGGYGVIRDEMKNVYKLTYYHSKKLTIEFKDSLKLLGSSVDDLPNERNIEKLKDYDYKKIRNEKKIEDFTDYDLLYVKSDVWKVKDVLTNLLELIGDSLTIGSSSYKELKQMFNNGDKFKFKNTFPELSKEDDLIIRKAYNGGIVALNPKYKGVLINKPVISYDVNSLFPSVMLNSPLPYGTPKRLNEKINIDKVKNFGYNLFVFCVVVKSMKIKKTFHPFIDTTKNYTLGKKEAYPREIKNHIFYWTNIDLELIEKYYNIDYRIILEQSFAFKSKTGMFTSYINKYKDMKENAPNKYIRMFAKLRLNTVYGKFGTRPERLNYLTNYIDEEMIDFELSSEVNEVKEKYYLPVAVFITAFARKALIEGLQDERSGFIYCDTDSLHIFKDKYNNSLKTDSKVFGLWKFEGESTKTLFINNKQYLKLIDNNIERKIASLSKSNQHLVNFENAFVGSVIEKGKKMGKHVKGGYIIIDTDFTFK